MPLSRSAGILSSVGSSTSEQLSKLPTSHELCRNAHHSHLHNEQQTRFVGTPPGVLQGLLVLKRGAHKAVLHPSAHVVLVGLARTRTPMTQFHKAVRETTCT